MGRHLAINRNDVCQYEDPTITPACAARRQLERGAAGGLLYRGVEATARPRTARHLPPNESLKLYLAENWIRTSSDVKPSRKFSRFPHWISGPMKMSGVGW